MNYYWAQSRGSHFIGLIEETKVNPFYKRLQTLEIPNISLQLSFGAEQRVWLVVESEDKTFQVFNSPLGVVLPVKKAYVLHKPVKSVKGENILLKEKSVEIKTLKELGNIFGVEVAKPKRKK